MQDLNPFTLDAKKMHGDLLGFIHNEARFNRTSSRSPQLGEELHLQLNRDLVDLHTKFTRMMMSKKVRTADKPARRICWEFCKATQDFVIVASMFGSCLGAVRRNILWIYLTC